MSYSPALRLLAALDLLQSRPSVTAAQLAERLEVEPRSVRRYIGMLREIGVPVVSAPGRYGGYRVRPGYKLPPLMLDGEEALAVTLGLLLARRLGLGGATPSVERALTKIERVLPAALRERAQAIQETVSFGDLSPHAHDATAHNATEARAENAAGNADALLTLSDAAWAKRRVWLRYASRASGATERLLDPYGVVFHRGVWYVAGYCHLRQETRLFRLDRIAALTPQTDTFDRPEGFDALAFLIERVAAIPARWRAEALLLTTLEQASQLAPAEYATLEAAPGGVLLRAYDDDLDRLARFLVRFGCPVQVHEPPELRAALRRLADALRTW